MTNKGAVVKHFFRVRNSWLHSLDQKNVLPFYVNLYNGDAIKEQSLINLRYKFVKPRNDCTCRTFLGIFQSVTALIFMIEGLIPAEARCVDP